MTAWSFSQQGQRPVKFRSSLFKGLGEAHVPEGTRSGPLGLGEPRGLTGRGAKRRRWKPQWGFQGHVPDHREGCPPGRPSQRAKCFTGGSIFLCFFLFAIEKERRKPSALHRGRHPGRGAAGLLVTNGGSRLELKSPTGRCQGGAPAAHQKHPGGMFLRAAKRKRWVSFWLAQGFFLGFTFWLR